MNRAKSKAPRGGAKRAKSMPPVYRNTSNKSRRRSVSQKHRSSQSSSKRRSSTTSSTTSSSRRQSSLFVPAILPPSLTALSSITKPTSKVTTIGQAVLTNIQDLRGIVWQRLCSMLASADGGAESYQSDCKLSFIDAYIKATSSLEANLNEINRDYLKQLVLQRNAEDDDMFLEITQELFRLQRLFTTACSTGRVCVAFSGRARDPKAAIKSSGSSKNYRINSNPLAEVAVRDTEVLGKLLDNFFHGEPAVIDAIPDHCFWMRRNILMRCSAREHSTRKQRVPPTAPVHA